MNWFAGSKLTSLSFRPFVRDSCKAASPLDSGSWPRKENELDFLDELVTVWVAVMVDVRDAKAVFNAATERADGANVPRPMEVNCWRSSKSNPSPKPIACMRSKGNSANIFWVVCIIWVPSAGRPSLKIRRCGVPKAAWRIVFAAVSPSTKWVPRLATSPAACQETSCFACPAAFAVKCTLLVSLKEIKENLTVGQGKCVLWHGESLWREMSEYNIIVERGAKRICQTFIMSW